MTTKNTPNINDEREIRKEKLQKLIEKGINPYPSQSSRTHKIKEVFSSFNDFKDKETKLIIAGRLRSFRSHGNLSFVNLEDDSGRIQVAISKKEVGAEEYKTFVKLIDVGDFVEFEGICFVTHKGENSLMAKSWKLLSKSIRPLPEKWHGLEDIDKRQRFRELDMISNRDVFAKFQRRSRAIKTIREFMWENGFTEIETPILQTVYGGTYAKPFMTHYNALDFDLYLRIAPELFLKRAITGGFEKIFEIGKCFRNEGMGPAHLQEFTMFEFYWPYVNYEKLMTFTEELIARVIESVYKKYEIVYKDNKINFKPPFPRKTFKEIIKEYLGVELSEIDNIEKLQKYVQKNNLESKVDLKNKPSWASQMDELYKKTIRNQIINPVFITDYPKEFMALAKTKDDDPKTVATFQLVVNTWELIKAYNELNNPIDQKERFEAQERLIMEGDEEAMPYDKDFVESMEYGMPPIAGWGMGLDRFFALLEEEDNLRDLVLFPTMKPIQE